MGHHLDISGVPQVCHLSILGIAQTYHFLKSNNIPFLERPHSPDRGLPRQGNFAALCLTLQHSLIANEKTCGALETPVRYRLVQDLRLIRLI